LKKGGQELLSITEERARLLKSDSLRIARLKERLLNAPYEICLERAKHFTRVYKETEGMHPALRNALALKETCEKQPVHIYPDEWIVGNKTDKFLSPVIAPERGDSLRALQMEMDVLSAKARPFHIDPEDKKVFLEEIVPYWEGKTLRDLKGDKWTESGIIEPVRGDPLRTIRQIYEMLRFAKHLGKRNLRMMAGIRGAAPRSLGRAILVWKKRDEISKNNPNMGIYCYDVQGHLHLGVEKVVLEGFLGIRDRARERIGKLDEMDPSYTEKKAFLEAVIISMEAATTYAERLRRKAIEMASSQEDIREIERLKRIAETLSHSPARPARKFREGVQAIWLALLVGEIQYGMHDVLGIGRADQYLYPLFLNDFLNGEITIEEAVEILEELNLKLTANISLFPEVGAETNATLGVSQHCLIIGGRRRDGSDATNELSYLMLDAYERMNGAINQLSVRISSDSPVEFLNRAVKVFRKTSGHAFFNDDVIIPALERNGLSKEDARDYTIVGCIETSGGHNCFPCPGGHEIVLPAVLYMTLTNGLYPAPIFGQKRGLKTGRPEDFKDFDQFFEAFKIQLRHCISTLVKAIEGKDLAYMEMLPAPYVSALIDGCIENATDMTGGGAKYDFTSIIARGLGTTVDSLMAVREFVFERKEITLKELVRACFSNFERREDLRMRLLNSPHKYGRGDKESDLLAKTIVKFFVDEVEKHKNVRGGRYRAGMYSYGNHVLDGFYLGATPDGRKRGEPTSNGISPSNIIRGGNGLTALLSSVASINQAKLSGGVALNVKIHPSCLKSEEGVQKIAALIKTYFDLGGMHIQPNVVSSETLKDAQKNPERYRDLVVKVAGYSAYFTDLGKSIQEDIIDRYEYA